MGRFSALSYKVASIKEGFADGRVCLPVLTPA